MKIKKIAQSIGVLGKVLNSQSSSNQDTYSCEYINNLNTYSTAEQRIGTWVNGKPLYRKYISGTMITASLTLENIDNLDMPTKITGILWTPSNYKVQIPEYTSSTNFCALVLSPSNAPIMTVPSAFVNSTFELIIEYTKTTD